jgi:hypothetical protein
MNLDGLLPVALAAAEAREPCENKGDNFSIK